MATIKFLHVTDLHFNPLNRIPSSRTKDFHDQIAMKWSFISNLIKKDPEIKAGFISGDVFHLKNPTYHIPEYLFYYADLFEMTNPIPWYSIPGNHDLPKSSFDLYNSSPYALLTRATTNLNDISLKTIKLNDTPPIHVTGLPFYPLDKTVSVLPKINKHISSFPGFNILLLHADMMKDDTVQLFWDTIGYDKVLDQLPNVDLICLGHIHTSFPIYNRTNPTTGKPQLISKPWSFSRIVKDYFAQTDILEKQHKPSYSLITFTIEPNIFNVDILYHEIPHEPFVNIFKKESLLKEIENSTNLKSFMNTIKQDFKTTGKAGFENPEDFMKRASLPKEVRELIFEYLGE